MLPCLLTPFFYKNPDLNLSKSAIIQHLSVIPIPSSFIHHHLSSEWGSSVPNMILLLLGTRRSSMSPTIYRSTHTQPQKNKTWWLYRPSQRLIMYVHDSIIWLAKSRNCIGETAPWSWNVFFSSIKSGFNSPLSTNGKDSLATCSKQYLRTARHRKKNKVKITCVLQLMNEQPLHGAYSQWIFSCKKE